jgi:RNA polymerase sigma-70 factor (ECF subfamily)
MTEKEFRQRVLPLQRLMYGLALKMGMPPDDAADVVQETQIKLWRHRVDIPDDDGALRMYSLSTLRRECITMMRRRKPAVTLDAVAEFKAPEERASTEYRDTRHRIEVLIGSLPPGQSKVVRLSSFGGLDNAEIAEATGLSEANVRQLLSRGRRRLRELMDNNNLSS